MACSLWGCAVAKLAEGAEPTASPTPTAAPTPIAKLTAVPTPTAEPTVEPTPEPPAESTPEADAMSEKVKEIMDSMSLEEKIGQMFIVRCPKSYAAEDIARYNIGNFILFGRDFQYSSKEEVAERINSYQAASKIPMFIGVDEEGGEVTRISRYPQFCEENYLSPRDLYAIGGIDEILSVEKDKIGLLKELGINMNLAPVADISLDESDYMYKRSLGQSPEITADFVTAVTGLYTENGMAAVIKHFPGYGNNADTHSGIAVDQRNLMTFEQSDLVPFAAGMASGDSAVLVSHNIVECFDAERPASLSPQVHDYIRNVMGFNGVIMTDDLFMDAIKDYTDEGSAALTAIHAGNDLLCYTDYKEQIPDVVTACQNGEITEERINESVERILTWKCRLGLIDG